MAAPKGLLEFSNHLLQLQWVAATLGSIEKEAKTNGSPLTSKSLHVSLLLPGTQSHCLATVQSSCSTLFSAVGRGWVDHQSLMAALVSQTAAAKHHGPVVHTIAEMLAIEVKEMVAVLGYYNCPYSIRTSIHPFISVLNSCPNAGLLLVGETVQQLQDAVLSRDGGSLGGAMVQAFEPFVKYLLLHPSPSSELTLVANQLHSDLLSVAKKTSQAQASTILKLLSKMLALQAVSSTQQLMSVASQTQQLVVQVASLETLGPLALPLLDACFSLCCELTSRGLPSSSSSLLAALSSLLRNKEVSVCAHHWFCLGWLLLRNLSSPRIVRPLLEICRLVLLEPSSSFLHILTFPLVQLLSQPAPQALGSRDIILTNQRTAADLLQLIQSSKPVPTPTPVTLQKSFSSAEVDIPHTVQECTASLQVSSGSSCSHKYSELVSASELYSRLADTPSRQPEWLRGAAGDVGGDGDVALLFLAGLSLAPQMLDRVLPVFSALAKHDPTTAPSILTYYLHLLSLLESPDSKLAVIYSIPPLATHRLATVGVVNMLEVLGATPSLVAIAIRLMGRVCALQDSVFPRLLAMLQRPVPLDVAMEANLAKAAVIKDICCSKAEKHGEETLSLISGLLSASHDPLPVAMVIEGLTALCSSEVVDVVTVWGVLGQRLASDGRQGVWCAVCGLLALASDHLQEEKSSHQSFKRTALSFLWATVFSRNAALCSAALKGLSQFQLADFLVSHLPDKVSAQLGIGSPDPHLQSHDSDSSAIPLVGSHCIKLLPSIPSQSIPSYVSFLAGLLGNEVKAVPRGVVYSALRQAEVLSQLERILLSMADRLRATLAPPSEQDDTTPPALECLSVLSLYQPSSSRTAGRGSSSSSSSRQQATDRLHQSLSLLGRLLRGCVSVELRSGGGGFSLCECLTSLAAVEQWRHFMETLLEAFLKVRLLETSSVSVHDNPDEPVVRQKRTTAVAWSHAQVQEKLLQLAKVDPRAAPNAVMALVALASCSNLIGHSDHMTESNQSESHRRLLLDLCAAMESVLASGHPLPPSNAMATLLTKSALEAPSLKACSVLSLPHLVEAVLSSWQCPPASIAAKLLTLTQLLFDEFNRSPQWYVALSLSRVLQKTLPLLPQVDHVLDKLAPFIDISVQTLNMDLLPLTSAFLPVLCLKAPETASRLLSSVSTTLTTLTPSQLLSPLAQLLSFNMANGLSDCLLVGAISDEAAMQHVQLLARLATHTSSVSGYHFSLALSLNGLSCAGLRAAQTLSDTIAAQWLQQLAGAGEPLLPNLEPVLWGVAGLLGVNPIAARRAGGVLQLGFLSTLVPLAVAAMEKLMAASSGSVASLCRWLLTQTHWTCSAVLEQGEKVPRSYSYLPETSLLTSLFQLVEGLVAQPNVGDKKLLSQILRLVASCEGQLPPADFSSVLIPLCRHIELRPVCVDCLTSSSCGGRGFSGLAIHCCLPPVYLSMQPDSQCQLVEGLPSFSASLHPHSLSQLLQMVCKRGKSLVLQSEPQLLSSLLKGVCALLRKGELCAAIKHLLVAIVTQLYSDLSGVAPVIARELQVVSTLADCLRLCGSMQTEALSEMNCLSCALHSTWVANGNLKFTALSLFLEWSLNSAREGSSEEEVVLAVEWLLAAIEQSCSPSVSSSLLHQTELLHLLSTWSRSHTPSTVQMAVLLKMVTCSVNQLLPRTVCGLKPWQRKERVSLAELCACSSSSILHVPASPALRERLCQCLTEWLAVGDSELRRVIIGLLSELKGCDEFRKPVIWTTVAHIV